MAPRSRLHVPHPPARPGQDPDFSYLEISPAGAVNRPDITASARDIENLSLEMVRVLDDEQPFVLGAVLHRIGLGVANLVRCVDHSLVHLDRN